MHYLNYLIGIRRGMDMSVLLRDKIDNAPRMRKSHRYGAAKFLETLGEFELARLEYGRCLKAPGSGRYDKRARSRLKKMPRMRK